MPAVSIGPSGGQFSPNQDEMKPPYQLWPQRMGGGALKGGPVVRAGEVLQYFRISEQQT